MRFVLELFDQSHNEKVQDVISRIRTLINSYVLGLLIEMSVVAVLIFTSLMIIGVKYALLISIMAAVLNIIPYLGIYFCMAIAMIITATTGTTGHVVSRRYRLHRNPFRRCQCYPPSCGRRKNENESFYHYPGGIDRAPGLGYSGYVFVHSPDRHDPADQRRSTRHETLGYPDW